MSNVDYLVSIVIATHNRSKYAIPCIESLLSIGSSEIQVVVHDTSNDVCELAAWAGQSADSRLIYVHWADRLSMTENHERALKLATGEYICLIGDDDTVSSYIIDIANYAKKQNIKMLTPKVKAAYYWPDFRTKNYGAAHAGRIYLSHFDYSLTKYGVKERLDEALSLACQGTDGMPKLYHGLVLRSLLDDIRALNGTLLYGTSPDMSASVSLCLTGGEYYLIDFPFTMPGGGGGSNSGRSATGKHKGGLDKDPHLTPFKNLNWSTFIPRFFSVETVWGHAAWDTLEHRKSVTGYNLSRLYALCFFHHPDYARETYQAWLNAKQSGLPNVGTLAVCREIVSVAGKYVLAKLKRVLKPAPSNGSEVIAVVENVALARKRLDERLFKKLAGSDLHTRLTDLPVLRK
ncbi:glycosyltransferase [Pseudomonas sp. MF6751]|uniref:glycosyltransferase n=3 Tax=Pseudomonas TaxID=286 RepID=UPI0018E5DC5C|nr:MULTISPECIES: glycosyltransferase [Pseudomonas]MBI6657959.1 glycosyltransferase [Pseudomonas carnis]MBI6687217.1 glycosyltransferase [Pseudomonas carnis]MBK3476645.1 glycosyltransferase [Pseudomonas sp. MF6751]